MVGKQKETAEQKLLKMIEVSSGDGLSAGKSHQKTVKKQDAVALLKVFNIFLILGVLISFGLLANEVKAGLDLANQSVEINTSSSGVDRGRDTPLDPLVQNVGFYLSATSVRNLFVPYQEVVVKATVRQSEDMAIVRKTKNFKLVGISWFDHVDTASAMIEDTDKKVTYFLQKGEKVDELSVDTIYADSVEFSYQDEEIIIRYE